MYDPRKLMGVTKLDVCRAQAFWAELADTVPSKVDVPVVGGHAGVTILPLLSQVSPPPPPPHLPAPTPPLCSRPQISFLQLPLLE